MIHIIVECVFKFPDVLAGEFTGREIYDKLLEHNCRLLEALAGEFRGYVKQSNIWYTITDTYIYWQESSEVAEYTPYYWKCNCILLDVLVGKVKGHRKENNI